MASRDRNASARVLSSDWTGLSPHLIASFYPVEKTGDRWARKPESAEVQAPLSDASLESSQNWTSQFENSGVQQSFASLSAILQTGSAAGLLDLLGDRAPPGFFRDGLQSAARALSDLKGVSGVTKLNSTQVFTGSPPLKLTTTVHFRALSDPIAEVQEPCDQLLSWSLPEKLAPDGLIGTAARDGRDSGIATVYPSKMPALLAMRYADTLWLPVVIESISTPLTVARDRNGRPLHKTVTLTVGTLTAWDADDYRLARLA